MVLEVKKIALPLLKSCPQFFIKKIRFCEFFARKSSLVKLSIPLPLSE